MKKSLFVLLFLPYLLLAQSKHGGGSDLGGDPPYTSQSFPQVLPMPQMPHFKPVKIAGARMENDVVLDWIGLGRLNSDRNYTGALGIYTSIPVEKMNHALMMPHWALLRLFPAQSPFDPYGYGTEKSEYVDFPIRVMFGGLGFTPDDLRASKPIVGDRPYGSFIYMNTRIARLDTAHNKLYSSDFYIGAIGLDAPRVIQGWLHVNLYHGNDTIDPVIPKGWNNQISDGGELTFLWVLSQKRLISPKFLRPKTRNNIELKTEKDLSLGYVTRVGYGLETRIGLLDPANWTDNTNTLGNTTGMIPGEIPARKAFEIFVYAGLKQNLVLYNALLSGQFKESVYTVKHRPFVTEWRYGIGLNLRWSDQKWINGLRLSIGGNGRTKEFYGSLERMHHWGGVSLEFLYL